MVRCSLLLLCAVLLFPAAAARAAAHDVAVSSPGIGGEGRSESPVPTRLDSRLALYGEKLALWRNLGARTAGPALAERRPAEWAGCFAAVENLALGYSRLKEEIDRRKTLPEPERGMAADLVWPVFFDDIAFLEGGCGQVYQQVSGLAGGGEPRGLSQGRIESVVQRPQLGEEEQLEKWNKAVGLFDSGNFDEAISEFGWLLNSRQAAAAREKIREAQTLAATQLRRQAAGILAKKTDDPARNKKLLEESWSLLNKIIITYPEAAIIDKVRQNQAQIEVQLNQLDPALLERLKGGPAS